MRWPSHLKVPLLGKNDCVSGFGKQMYHVGYIRVWLDRNFWMNRSCSGRQLVVVQMPVTHEFQRSSLKIARLVRFLQAHHRE